MCVMSSDVDLWDGRTGVFFTPKLLTRCSPSPPDFQALQAKNGVWHPPAVVWSHWATLTLWSGSDSILPLLPLERFPNDLATPMDLQRRLPKPPGQDWRLAPSSCRMVSLFDADPFEWRRLHLASSSFPTTSKRLLHDR